VETAPTPRSGIQPTRFHFAQFRWIICSLLFFATLIAYVDRGVIAYLEKFLSMTIGWNSVQYSNMTSAFLAAYAIGLVSAGWFTDFVGTRRGFAFAITLWSFAAMLPATAHSAAAFGVALFILGLGEAANFPACIKTVAEWFPKQERALATGIFNSGANVGNIVVPLVVPLITLSLGWRWAFVITGSFGLVWLALWLWLYRKPEEHRHVSPQELLYIESDREQKIARVPWKRLFPQKETWAFAIGKFLTDPIWWFYLFWLPKYLQTNFHLSLTQAAAPVAAVYVISIGGSVGGGWIPALFLKAGRSLNYSRKTAMLICALAVVPVVAAPHLHHLWLVVCVVGLAAAAHQGWSANIFTIPSDTFPKSAVASVVGIGGLAGAVGGVLLQKAAGYIVHATHSYLPLFIVAASGYLLALLIIHLLTPRLAPARV
jgi:MFS transporter, ACS family, hexuronate transporter